MKWVLLLPALLAVGCASSGTLRDFRGIIHCHSLYSHDSKGTYQEILAAAKAAKVDFVIMTDHPPDGDPGLSLREGWKGLHDGVLFIQGHELAGSNLLALGIREPVRGKSPPEKIEDIHRQGGLAIVSHPEEVKDWEPYLTADGMEIYNVHAAFTRLRKSPAKLAAALKAVKEDPEHSFMHLQELDPAVLAKWDEINRTRRFVGIAGNDSHQNVNILGLQLDPYPRAFKFVSTHVLSEELTEASILEALRRGRCYVAFDGTGSSESFALAWHEEQDGRSSPMGDEIILRGRETADLSLTWDVPGRSVGTGLFRSSVAGGDPTLETYITRALDINGRVLRNCYFLPHDGAYRFTIFRDLPEGSRPWILTNPVSVRRAP